MKLLSSKTLNTGATNVTVERGEMQLDLGRTAKRLRMRMTLPITRTTGGAMNDAEKQALLALILFTLDVGTKGTFQKPWIAQSLAKVQKICRVISRCDFGRYADAVDGLAYVLVANTQATLTLDVLIPFGIEALLGDEKDVFGVGRSQLALMRVNVRKTGDTIAAGLTISGPITLSFYADEAEAKGDRWCPLGEFSEQSQVDVKIKGPDGLNLHAAETSAVQASSVLTNVEVKVGAKVIHTSVGVNDFITPLQSESTTPVTSLTTDRETLIESPTLKGNIKLRQMPTGPVELKQLGTRQLTTMNVSTFTIPVKSAESIETEVMAVAKDIRKKTIKAISLATTDGLNCPDNLRPFVPFVLVDTDDSEFERFAGLQSESGSQAVPRIPAALVAAGRNTLKALEGDRLAQSKLIRSIAAQIPGAVQSSRGFADGSTQYLANVEALLRG